MNVKLYPRRLSGSVTPPPSKSMAHRLLIAASLAAGRSHIRNIDFSQDVEATLRCMSALGARWETDGDGLVIDGVGGIREPFGTLPEFDCGESGSTLRFLIPISLTAGCGGIFRGRGRLMERPQQPYFDLFVEKGIRWEQSGDTLKIEGQLTPGEYRLPGNVSSQFFTGLLFALPLLDAPCSIVSTTPLESAPYVTMTMGALQRAFVPVRYAPEPERFHTLPSVYQPFDAAAEADWSQAAFWYTAAVLGNPVRLRGMDSGSFQGDKVIAAHARKLSRPGDTRIDLSSCPDLLPPLAVMAAVRQGRTEFYGGARLRLKESDRLATVREMLEALSVRAEENPDGLTVHGGGGLQGGIVDGANDHRIVMAAAVAATRCDSPVTIIGAEAVRKSYPQFWHDYEKLGGEALVL